MTKDARPGGTGHNGNGSASAAPREGGVPSGVPKEESPPKKGDAALFEKLAGIVDDGLRADRRIGETLKKISDEKLYRAKYATWEKYLSDRHGMSTSHAHRMIEAADTARLLSPMGDKMRERHLRAVRPLALKDAERARRLLRELIEGTGGVLPTTRQIEAGVDRALGRDPMPDWNIPRDRLAEEHGEGKVRLLDSEGLMGGRIRRKDRDELARQRLLERATQANGIVRGRHLPRFERVDFNALDVERESVDLLLTDPPYKGEFLHLWKELGAFAARVLKPEGFLVAYVGSYHFDEAYGGLIAAGLRTRWIMGVRHLHGSPTVHRAGFSNSLKPILVLGKGEKRNKPKNAPVEDFLSLGEGDGKTRHPWGQDFAEAERLLLGFTDPDDLVCDPFAGGGTVPLAAMLNGRRAVASEIDPWTHADAARLIREAYDAAAGTGGEVQLLRDGLAREETPDEEGCRDVVEAVSSGFDAA